MSDLGTELWMEICDSLVEDRDRCMADAENTERKSTDVDVGARVDSKLMEPYRMIDGAGLSHYAREITSLAALKEKGNGKSDIRVTCGPVYRFFEQKTVDRFKDRVYAIIEAAQL